MTYANRIDWQELEKHLLKVQKPGRYFSNDLNSIVKETVQLRGAISYPDLYEIGMSNQGISILYDVANSIADVACERVFAVLPEFEELLRSLNYNLYTLETGTYLHALDYLGFNLSHELLYSNVLQILDLGGIPVLSKDRSESDPLIFGGGEAASNPFPVAHFFDAFVIGEGEEVFPEILQMLKKLKTRGARRSEKLEALSAIPGLLIPSHYSMTFQNAELQKIEGPVVKKRICRNMNQEVNLQPLVPSVRITQERAVVEVSRGCHNMCRFCHAGFYNLPYRYYTPELLVEKTKKVLGNTGYNELTLASLSVSDYPLLSDLLNNLLPYLTENGISISLPSLKVDKGTLSILERLSDVKRTSLTFAIESASEEIRQLAHKKVKTSDLFDIVDYVFQRGWRHLKFYFMLGLPGCEEHNEGESVVTLLREILERAGHGKTLNVTLSPFIPKPHTPFEGFPQQSEEYFQETILYIKQNSPRSVKIKSHDVKASVLEALFARGTSELGPVIKAAYERGCRLDSWGEHVKYDVWFEELDKHLPDWRYFLGDMHEKKVPWSCIHTGYERLTEIRKGIDFDLEKESAKVKPRKPLDVEKLEKAFEDFQKRYDVKVRVRLMYSKMGKARFIPHLDLVEIFKRAFRMANIPMSMSQGFNKRERLTFGFPVPLGIESRVELCDLDLFNSMPRGAIDEINSHLPKGIEVHSLMPLEEKAALMTLYTGARYSVSSDNYDLMAKLLSRFTEKPDFIKRAKKRERTVAFNETVRELVTADSSFEIDLPLGSGEAVRIDHIISQLLDSEEEILGQFSIVKIKQYMTDEWIPVE